MALTNNETDENDRGLLARLKPQGRDAISIVEYLIILLVLVWLIVGRDEELAEWRFYGAILCVVAILLAHAFQQRLGLFFKDQSRTDIFLVSAISLLALVATWLSQNSLTIYLPAMITGMAFRLLQSHIALVLSLIVTGLWLLIARSFPNTDQDEFLGYVVSLFLGAFLFAVIGMLIRRNNQQTERAQKLASELQAVNIELLATRQRDKELAATEERMQLAREIHDGLGHHLTVLTVQLQVAQKLIEQSPERVAQIIEICRDEAQAALEEVRRSVTVMRSTPLDTRSLEDALEKLVNDYDQISPLVVIFEMKGEPYELAPAASMTCYRFVQEGLTNIQKHANEAVLVEVAVDYKADGVRIRVKDDGKPGREPEGHSGYGLVGLRERAGQLGGELRAGPDENGGFLLELLIPTE